MRRGIALAQGRCSVFSDRPIGAERLSKKRDGTGEDVPRCLVDPING